MDALELAMQTGNELLGVDYAVWVDVVDVGAEEGLEGRTKGLLGEVELRICAQDFLHLCDGDAVVAVDVCR